MKYIDADRLKAEIEKFMDPNTEWKHLSKEEISFMGRCKTYFFGVITYLQQKQPSLPSNLDEAAEEYAQEEMMGGLAERAFKAGAEWMAEQGVCADAEVCKLADRVWVTPLDEKLFQNEVYDKLKAGDKVVVQIRKKN